MESSGMARNGRRVFNAPRLCLVVAVIGVFSASGLAQAQSAFVPEGVDGVVDWDIWATLALDSNGRPHVGSPDEGTGEIKYAQKTGAAWVTEIVEAVSGIYVSIALDAVDAPRLSYTTNVLRYAEKIGSNWIRETVDDDPGFPVQGSLALNALGEPGICYFLATPNLMYASRSGSAWTREIVDPNAAVGFGAVSHLTSLVFDSAGRPRIAYIDYDMGTGTGTLKYAEYDGIQWALETVVPTGTVGSVSMGLDSGENPIISYGEAGGDLMLATRVGTSWVTESTGAPGFNQFSLALTSQDEPRISYRESGSGPLRVSMKNGATWSSRTIDSQGGHTSLATDGADRLHVIYRFDQQELRYGVVSCCFGSWTQPTLVGPSARRHHASVYDPVSDKVVVFGGADATGPLDDTWTWDGIGWTQESPANIPSPRQGAAMVYDSSRDVVVLHGGVDGGVYSDETWEWNGADWTLITTTGPAVHTPGIAFDPVRGITVLYGGFTSSGRSKATWEYDGLSWTRVIESSAPDFRAGHAMVYVNSTGLIHMFGGQTPGSAETNDNWTYDGSTTSWTSLGASGPSPRLYHDMAYEPACDKIVLYGGTKDGVYYDDVWTYDGSWQQTDASAMPGDLAQTGFEYVSNQGYYLLFGGYDGIVENGETWQYGCNTAAVAVEPGAPAFTRTTTLRNTPNPFRGSTSIEYQLVRPGVVSLEVYDSVGRRVRTLERATLRPAGEHRLVWDGRDDRGRHLSSGTYIYRLETPTRSESGRMSLIR